MALQWLHMSLWRVRSLITQLFVKSLVHASDKENSKDPHLWSFVRGIHQWLVDSPHEGGQIFRKCFHIMISLCHITYCSLWQWHFEGILPKGPYLPCVSMAGRALLAGYPQLMGVRWVCSVHHLLTHHSPDSKVHGAHLGLTGTRWAPCWPHELCYLGHSPDAIWSMRYNITMENGGLWTNCFNLTSWKCLFAGIVL